VLRNDDPLSLLKQQRFPKYVAVALLPKGGSGGAGDGLLVTTTQKMGLLQEERERVKKGKRESLPFFLLRLTTKAMG